jgi:peptide/nickel transport system permease protein
MNNLFLLSTSKKSASLTLGAGLSLFIILVSLLGLIWTPHNPQAMDMALRLAPSSAAHWLGTDAFGRDLFSQLLAGMKNSFFIAFCAVGLGGAIGVTLSHIAVLAQNIWLHKFIARTADFIFVFPALITAILLATLYGPSILNAIIAIAIFNIPVFFRISRSLCLTLLAQDYLRAARALGQTRFGLLRRHLLPGSAGVLITQFTVQLAMALLAEASLSYLGLGVPPPEPSLGRLLQEAQTYMVSSPRLALIPGGMIALAVLAFNLLGDGLRDKIDPRRRQFFC